MILKSRKLIAIIFSLLLLLNPALSFAQSNPTAAEQAEARLVKVEILTQTIEGSETKRIKVEAFGLSGSINDKTVNFEQSISQGVNTDVYKVDSKVYIAISTLPDGTKVYGITDFIRTENQIILFIIFLIVLVFVGGLKGIRSLIGLIISLFIIVLFVIPNILNGSDALIISLIGSAMILLATVLFVHGLNKKSVVAIAGALLSLLIAAILSIIFSQTGKITGTGNDDALYLFIGESTKLKAQGLFLAGVIIGTLGVLIDMTVGQASSVQEIDEVNPELSFKQLYQAGMNVGKDHIGSLVNTLFLAYAGASLPLLISFTQTKEPLLFTLSLESTAIEILRALVGSIALILAVPLTTLIAVFAVKKLKKN